MHHATILTKNQQNYFIPKQTYNLLKRNKTWKIIILYRENQTKPIH